MGKKTEPAAAAQYPFAAWEEDEREESVDWEAIRAQEQANWDDAEDEDSRRQVFPAAAPYDGDGEGQEMEESSGVRTGGLGQIRKDERKAHARPYNMQYLQERGWGSLSAENKQNSQKDSPAAAELDDLDDSVFNRHRDHLPKYSEKERLIKLVEQKFKAVRDLSKLSQMYQHINLTANKCVLNVHVHPIYDKFFFKSNTNSWQKLIEEIRNHAFNILLIYIGIDDRVLRNIKNNRANIQYPDCVKEELERYLADPLFCEHRSNDHFLNLFHSTKKIKIMHMIIDACDAQIKKKMHEGLLIIKKS